MELTAELSRRVDELNIGRLLGGVLLTDYIRLACDLLVAGVETPAVVEVAAAPPDDKASWAGIEEPINAMFVDLGRTWPDTTTAAWIRARMIATAMLSGELSVAIGGEKLWSLANSVPYTEMLVIHEAVDEYGLLGGEARMTGLAEDVLREAAERLDR
ncbi:hypothetical protein [Kutzneria buriramensis]|uniref:Uncharacterized protein n=1 Tax=Kutzneria buriramensis TaxID=1045776 RepID=A0A3E0I8S6_9PSEU|nr:hypothetical protein [Kutzneria buriramensis]REH55029.1 hypothetical protein BCF44_10145 [Kutzneria buriramensis]